MIFENKERGTYIARNPDTAARSGSSGARRSVLGSWLGRLPAVWSWTSYLTGLCVRSFFCKKGIVTEISFKFPYVGWVYEKRLQQFLAITVVESEAIILRGWEYYRCHFEYALKFSQIYQVIMIFILEIIPVIKENYITDEELQ